MFVSTAIKARTPVALRGQTARANGYSIKLNTPDGPKTIDASADQAILDSAEAEGVELPYSCRKGNCGTCLARKQSGTMSYGGSTPAFLEDPQLLAKRALTDIDVGENGEWILACQAKPTSDMELETSPTTPVQGEPNQPVNIGA